MAGTEKKPQRWRVHHQTSVSPKIIEIDEVEANSAEAAKRKVRGAVRRVEKLPR